MIRRACTDDYTKILSLWLKGTSAAHPFIKEDYWKANQEMVKNQLLPQAQTYVFCDKHQIKGFISLLEDNYIGALFVDGRFQGRGIGRKLLEYVRRRRPNLSLKAYAQNEKAIGFYRHKGFKILSENMDNKTQAKELFLVWNKGCISGYAKRFPGDS